MPHVPPEAITLDTLKLLQETLEYLRRLPVVPMTNSLCRKLEAHLAAPHVATTLRLIDEDSAAASRERGIRVARRYAPTGKLMVEVVASPTELSYRFPELVSMAATNPKILELLQRGETLKFDR